MEAGAVGVFRRNEMALKIKGTVEFDGKTYEATGELRVPVIGDWFLGPYGYLMKCNGKGCGVCIILREVKPPAPKYRPFASAEEFEPHRDRWIARSGKGAMNVVEYSDSRVWLGAGSNPITFDDLMVWRFADDGSPCGVLVTE